VTRRRILVSGASVAGPALAWWLDRHGFDVTVVERASAVRSGGYPIDVRGTALEVVRRMGLEEELRRAHIHIQKRSFVDEAGKLLATVPGGLAGSDNTDLDLPRGALTAALFRSKPHLRYRFAESISALHDDGTGVDVLFSSGARERFDLVIGADGIHSNTRQLVFGPETQFSRYLGFCFAGFTLENGFGLANEGVIWATVGRAAMLFAVGGGPRVHALFIVALAENPALAVGGTDEQTRAFIARQFANDGWELPSMLRGLHAADDLFYDEIAQIRMPAWSQGRIALVGDAAYAPSFLTGQGTSLALVGAYVLAESLAAHADHRDAFAGYEARCRPFVEANQALADLGADALFPTTREALERRQYMLASFDGGKLLGESPREAYSMLRL
jgi:2-polyprenyl-6-methoxyphenol hydroxylase-like FAD-dependent oxidoreductase